MGPDDSDDEIDLDEGWDLEDDEQDDPINQVLCRHYSAAEACEVKCGECGHGCTDHGTLHSRDVPCESEGCECDEWLDPEDVENPNEEPD